MATRYENNSDKKRKRRVTIIIIVIIILLLLIRSCASEFNWTIGRIFGTSSEHEITEESDDIIILNKDLKFSTNEETITLNDKEYKIDFSYKVINPKEFTCQTSDANVATCYVKDNYVVINPKQTGNIEVFVETKTNNKTYKASMKLNITDITRSLSLSGKSGTIVLSKTNKKILTYNLHNIDGDVKVISSDTDIAEVKVKNGVITIIAKKAGNVKITVSVVDKNSNKTYQVVYKLSVVENIKDSSTNGKPSTTPDNNIGDVGEPSTTPGTTDKPNKPESTDKPSTPSKPDKPTPSPSPSPTPDEPTPTPTPSPSPTPDEPIVGKDENNYLKKLQVSVGTLTPVFNKETINYNVNVENNINELDITIEKDSNKSSVKYIFNNREINNLKDLNLNVGDNVLEIIVTAENKTKKTYTVIITRKQNPEDTSSNYLTSLSIDGYNLTPSFNKETSFYDTEIKYNDSSIKLNYTLEDNESTVVVTNNGNTVNDISNINLINGDNTIKVTVTTKTGVKKSYIVNVHKPVRTIEFSSTNHTIYIEDIPYNISYQVLEDNIEINDYNLNDISVNINNFNGTYNLQKGYISITPSNSDIGKTLILNITYNNKTTSTTFRIDMDEYNLSTPALEYDIAYVDNTGNKNIIINNDLLKGNITKTSITNGFRLTSSNGGYIDIIANNNLIEIDYDSTNSSNTSVIIKVKANNIGTSSVTVTGNIFGKFIDSYTINLNIIGKYNVVIDANGGFFDAFSSKYTYLVESTEEIDLSEFDALKTKDEENCLFFKLDSFNTKSDGTGTKYSKTDILTNFTKDLTIYAIYTAEPSFVELESNERLYLTEVDLFHNEEYYEKYNIDKVIYPGATGAHVMSITNNSPNKIKITGINLEEDTLCISSGKCLNIGYIIKSALDVNDPYTYFYGDNNNYQILNKDTNTTHTFGSLTGYHTENNIEMDPNIEIEVGETKEISILWKWVEIDNELDTKIGSSVSTIGNEYSLTVSIDFERINNTCVLP